MDSKKTKNTRDKNDRISGRVEMKNFYFSFNNFSKINTTQWIYFDFRAKKSDNVQSPFTVTVCFH